MGLALLLAISALFAAACETVPLSVQDPDQPSRLAGRAACDQERLPAQWEFVGIISQVLDTPPETIRLTRLKPWLERWQCCNDSQLRRIAEQGGNCASGECWTALAEARVPSTEDRGKEHVGFYVYSGSCVVYHDYHYRYGWQLGKP